MNFMNLKKLMIITGKTALEILEVVENANREIKTGSKKSGSNKNHKS